jgi:DNA processing protein
MDPKAYWVGFNLVKGIGAVRVQALLDHFGSLELAWQAPADALRVAGLSQKVVDNFLQVRQGVDLELVWDRIQKQDIQVFIKTDNSYPRRLKEIDQAPPVIYVRGDISLEDEWAVAIVGTRQVTAYGRQVAEDLAAFLARNGVTVVSGLARGVDGLAHGATLAAGGRTIAVLGSGVDRVYPPEHRQLAARIMERGALVSDYAPGTPPDGINFPPRNRIISGLSLATVVVEAGETSGALITATFAVEQGREVFAVPGNIHAPQSVGANRLIEQGARPLLRYAEILDVLHLDKIEEKQTVRKTLPGDETEARLLVAVTDEPTHIDEIGNLTGLPIEKVSATLALMELKGMVRQVGNMNYVIIREQSYQYRSSKDA